MNKFIRIKDDKVFFGVCSGLGVRTNIDPLVWRLLFFFLIFSPVPIITGYLLTTILTKSI
jgi:phage shock protein PspC (stress-responsive transcriptional regulator)